jgi:hypothetical protein
MQYIYQSVRFSAYSSASSYELYPYSTTGFAAAYLFETTPGRVGSMLCLIDPLSTEERLISI